MAILIYEMILRNDQWGIQEELLLYFVSEERKQKIHRYINNIDKKISLYSELILRRHLIFRLGTWGEQINFKYGKYGKPYLDLEDELHFNISHTRSAIVCGISEQIIGVDIEKIKNPPYEAMRQCYCKEEIESIMQISENMRDVRFFELWTAKEAYGKYLGRGIYLELNKINVLEFEAKILSWIHEDYCVAVYSSESQDIKKCIITEEEVRDFYI